MILLFLYQKTYFARVCDIHISLDFFDFNKICFLSRLFFFFIYFEVKRNGQQQRQQKIRSKMFNVIIYQYEFFGHIFSFHFLVYLRVVYIFFENFMKRTSIFL